jgi:hypothetical protein
MKSDRKGKSIETESTLVVAWGLAWVGAEEE